jgi:hypothetical protein
MDDALQPGLLYAYWAAPDKTSQKIKMPAPVGIGSYFQNFLHRIIISALRQNLREGRRKNWSPHPVHPNKLPVVDVLSLPFQKSEET